MLHDREYCVPENKEVTHGRLYHAAYKFVPICGRRTPCPPKEGDCPPGFSDGKMEAVCGPPDQPLCTKPPCVAFQPSPAYIELPVLVTLVG